MDEKRRREERKRGGNKEGRWCFEIKVNEPVRVGCTRRQFAFEGFPRPFNWNQIGIQLAPAPRDYAGLMLDGPLDLARKTALELLTLPSFKLLLPRRSSSHAFFLSCQVLNKQGLSSRNCSPYRLRHFFIIFKHIPVNSFNFDKSQYRLKNFRHNNEAYKTNTLN